MSAPEARVTAGSARCSEARSKKALRLSNPVRSSRVATIRRARVCCSLLSAAMLKDTTTSSTMVTSVVTAEPKYVTKVCPAGPSIRKTTSRAR